MSTLTSARQRNAVSEGAALGLLMCGRAVLPFDKIGVDLAFEAAWRDWSYAAKFPQVNTDLKKGLDAVWALTRADADKQVWVLYWETQGNQLEICARQEDWSVDDPADIEHAVNMIGGGVVPAEGWKELAQKFLQNFDR